MLKGKDIYYIKPHKSKLILNKSRVEQQIINYQTQQYRLFPALAATYAYTFTGLTMRNLLLLTQKEAVSFENIKPSVLAKVILFFFINKQVCH